MDGSARHRRSLFLVRTFEGAKVGFQLGSVAMMRPIRRSAFPEDVSPIDICAPPYEQAHDFVVTGEGSLMQRRGMGVTSKWVVAIWILSSVKEQFYDRDVPELRSKAECEVPVIVASRWKQPQEFVGVSEGGSNWQIDAGAPPNECLDRFKLAMERSRSRSAVGVGPMIAKQIDQGNLH